MRTIPRWPLPFMWAALLGAFHVALPWSISLLSDRHGWHRGYPGRPNDAGLIAVVGGALVVVWVLVQHFERSAQGVRLSNPFKGPGYVITAGPYAFSRHPMHVSGVSIWVGWTLFYGSLAVGIGTLMLALVYAAVVPSEERGIEAALGDEYRAYKARVPRWIGGRRK